MTLEKQRGQILLIVVLVVIVASTIALSLASRSITGLRTSTEEAESQKALAAAEAGIERAIQGSIPIALTNDQIVNNSEGGKNSSYRTTVGQVDGSSFRINGGSMIPKDEGADVWLIGHNPDGSLNYADNLSTSPSSINLYWGTTSDGACGSSNPPAAIQAVVVVRNSPTDIKSYRYVYDRCSRGNNFTQAVDAVANFEIDGTFFKYSTPSNDLTSGIPSPKNIILIRVVPIYKDAIVGVSSATALPTQGYMVNSIGTSGQASQQLKVFRGYPQTYLPYLSYGLFVAN
jgi:hypothetical protein